MAGSFWMKACLPPLQSCVDGPAMFGKYKVLGSTLSLGRDGTHPFTLNLMTSELNTPGSTDSGQRSWFSQVSLQSAGHMHLSK
ncbi:hypothetical protein WJX82_007699 [Trebouxia sp. C0006]